MMDKENLIWSKILTTVLKMPGVKVDRIAFLRKELRPYCNQSRLQMIGSVRPYTVVSEQVVDKLAKQCVTFHTTLATTTSAIAGLPGGLAMAATLPADLTQYFYHVFVLSQKLAYLYGYPDFFADDDEEFADSKAGEGEPSDAQTADSKAGDDEPSDAQTADGEPHATASDLLTIFMGVMMGAPVAEKGLGELSRAVAENAVSRLPRVALTKAALYPIVSQIARIIGTRLTKDSFAKSMGRLIPLAGGLFSGGLTLFTFRRGANRLRRQLRAQRHLFDDGTIDAVEMASIRASFVKANKAEHNPQLVQKAIIEAMINMGKINDEVSPEKYKAIEQRIARAKISAQDKLDMLGNIKSEHSYDVDFDLLATDREAARDAYEAMKALAAMDEKTTMAERIYLNMAAQKLGISPEND